MQHAIQVFASLELEGPEDTARFSRCCMRSKYLG